jgi:hypothetical protein
MFKKTDEQREVTANLHRNGREKENKGGTCIDTSLERLM